MKLAVSVHFEGGEARTAGVAFEAWDSAEPEKTYLTRMAHAEQKPARGELDLRELPCILQLLREHALAPELILIDGLVHADADETPALGQHLYHALGGRCAVMGVARNAQPGLPAQFEVMREEETRPLFVTVIGVDLGAAKIRLRTMHGRKRLPTLLKLATRLAKNGD